MDSEEAVELRSQRCKQVPHSFLKNQLFVDKRE